MNNDFFQDILGNGGVRVALIGVFAILALFLLVQTFAAVHGIGRSGMPATDTITVTGQGKASLSPDIAHVTFSVQNTAKSVALAQSATTEQSNAAIEYVRDQQIAEKDIKTLSYNVSPEYAYPNDGGRPTITGYQVSQTIQVTVRDLDVTGTLLAGLGALEVQNISGPHFALDNPNAGQDAARAEAIADAKEEAEVLAKQLGVRLGKIVSFSESGGGYPYPAMYAMDSSMGKGGAIAPEIPTGENDYSATVSITYEIR